MGYPPQTWDGVLPPGPGTGYPPDLGWDNPSPQPGMGYAPDLGQGTPLNWNGVAPSSTLDGVPPDLGRGTPPPPGIASTCYAASLLRSRRRTFLSSLFSDNQLPYRYLAVTSFYCCPFFRTILFFHSGIHLHHV